MSSMIYKSGQGYWTRLMTVIAGGLIGVLGAYWLWDAVGAAHWGSIPSIYFQAVMALLVCTFTAWLLWRYVAVSHRSVDFLVATEGEMKKVNWSTRRELVGSSMVVIVSSLMIALYCLGFDLFFTRIFTWMKVLQIDEGMGL
ncbi:MAG: preprotein translocase subunit SecE [Planctomycetota bacterium]|nr:preprotein translocase subunit SecE [Planctomycetota bacterium]MDA1105888.1 preprotein translocase subunit SecE [Planctomycetota bacterium]